MTGVGFFTEWLSNKSLLELPDQSLGNQSIFVRMKMIQIYGDQMLWAGFTVKKKMEMITSNNNLEY